MFRPMAWCSLVAVVLASGWHWQLASSGSAAADQDAKGKPPPAGPAGAVGAAGAAPSAPKAEAVKAAHRAGQFSQKLNQVIVRELTIDANTPLKDALDLLAEKYELPVLIDTQAFKRDNGDEAVEDKPVRLPQMSGVRLGTVLEKLAAQVHGAYLVRADHIDLTTVQRAVEEVWGPVYATNEEATGRKRPALPLVHTAFAGRPLAGALQELSDLSGTSMILDVPRAGEKAKLPVSATLDNVPVDTAARILASQADLRAVLLDNVLYVTTKSHAQAMQAATQKADLPAREGKSVETALAEQMRQPVELNLAEMDLNTVLQQLGREAGAKIVLDRRAEIEGQTAITLQVKDVSLETAVRLAAETAGLKPVLIGNVLFVTTEASAAKLEKEQERALSRAASQPLGGLTAAGVGLGGGIGGLGGGALGFAGGGAIGFVGSGLPSTAPPVIIGSGPMEQDGKPKKASKRQPEGPRGANRIAPLQRKLAEVINLKNGIDANTPLKDALEFLKQEYGLAPVLIDSQAFKSDVQIESVEDQPVKLPKMTGVRLGTVLQKLVAQVQRAYLVRSDHIEITTFQRQYVEVWGLPDDERRRRALPLVHNAFDQVPLETALRELSDATGVSVVLDTHHAGEKAKTAVTAMLNNVPLDTAVRLLADQAELQAVLLDNVLHVTTKEQARSLGAEQEKLNQRGIEILSPAAGPARM